MQRLPTLTTARPGPPGIRAYGRKARPGKACSGSLLAAALFAAALVAGIPPPARAETVYKYIDEQGRTVYSAQPPAQPVEKVDRLKVPDTRPSSERVEAAKKIHEQNLKAADTMEKTRKQREEIIADENRRKRENAMKYQKYEPPGEYIDNPYEQGPYYGIPGHGIIVLPGGPGIRPPIHRPPGSRPPGARQPLIQPVGPSR